MASSNRLSHDLMYVIRFHCKFKQIVSWSYVCNKVSWQAQTVFFCVCFAIIHSLEQRSKMHIVGFSHSPRKDKKVREKKKQWYVAEPFQREMVISGIWTHERWKETYLALTLLGAYIYVHIYIYIYIWLRKGSHWCRLMRCLRLLFIIFTL